MMQSLKPGFPFAGRYLHWLILAGFVLEAVPGIAGPIDPPEISKEAWRLAQVPANSPNLPTVPPIRDLLPPSSAPSLPPLEPLPPAEDLLNPPRNLQPTPSNLPSEGLEIPNQIQVKRFEFVGNTAFSDRELQQVLQEFINTPITSFNQLLQARTKIAQYYLERGYATTGAFLPPQKLQENNSVVRIQIVEGQLEEIRILGTQRLNPDYVRSRLNARVSKPLNINQLLQVLQVLQLDPLIGNLSAELASGTKFGQNLLIVTVREAPSFSTQIVGNNSRSPSVGSFRRGVTLREGNVLGMGDAATLSYGNTDGSGSLDLSYTVPINPRNGTLGFSYGNTASQVIEEPFKILDIRSNSRYYDLTYRQPVWQTPNQEVALGITASRRESDTSLLGIPFPLSAGADDEGRTRISAVRFFQEWTKRSSQQVIALRSQFSLGVDAFNATIQPSAPDSRFLSWRGQAQWVQLLARDTTVLVRGDLQLADRPLLPLEQFGIGGFETVRGYRQDTLLADNGLLLSAELRYPIVRIPKSQLLVHLVPFFDLGTVWNSGNNATNPSPETISAVGLGLQLTMGRTLSARLDYGVPLVTVRSSDRTWQENGLYFSIIINPF